MPVSEPTFKTQPLEMVLRMIGATLTVGLLIVLPVLKILGLA